MAKSALNARPGMMLGPDGKEMPRSRGFIDYPGDAITCRNGHPVKQFAVLHDGAMTHWCTYKEDRGGPECGEGIYMMGHSRSKVFWAWLTREETAEIAKGLLNADEILDYLGASGKMGPKKSG